MMGRLYDCGHSTDDSDPPASCPMCEKPKKRSKFGSVGVHTEYGYFRSTGEYKRYLELLILERNGLIRSLFCQVNYWLESIKQRVAWDFYYKEVQDDGSEKEVVEDYKGCITTAYRRNRKWFRIEYPEVELRETRAPSRRKGYRKGSRKPSASS